MHVIRKISSAVSSKPVPPVMAAVRASRTTEPDAVAAQWDQVADTLTEAFSEVATMMRDAKEDMLACRTSPKAHWQKIWSNNPIERLNREIKRRADVVEIFPNPVVFLRLATAVVIESHDEWQSPAATSPMPAWTSYGTSLPRRNEPRPMMQRPNL